MRVLSGRESVRALVSAISVSLLLGCGAEDRGGNTTAAEASGEIPASEETSEEPMDDPSARSVFRSDPVSDERLEIWFEIDPEVREDRVPMRTLTLHFRNLTEEPLRVYVPQAEIFRAGISTVVMSPESGPPLMIPEPHPHGYEVTEVDFPLIGPGDTREETQPFTLDPFARGGQGTARRAGFEAGASVRVHWTYENRIQRWAGGVETLDGTTQPLFGGGDIPHLWTGRLRAEGRWTVPD